MARHSSHSQAVTAVAVHEQAGKLSIYSAGLGSHFGCMGWESGERTKIPRTALRCPLLVLFHPTGAELATAGGNKSPPTELIVNRWRSDNLEELDFPLVDHTRLIKAAAYSPDGKLLATAAGDWRAVVESGQRRFDASAWCWRAADALPGFFGG